MRNSNTQALTTGRIFKLGQFVAGDTRVLIIRRQESLVAFLGGAVPGTFHQHNRRRPLPTPSSEAYAAQEAALWLPELVELAEARRGARVAA